MSEPTPLPPLIADSATTAARTLRRLFLTLFLRGRSARGLQKAGAPKSIGSKLALTLGFYGLMGLFSLFFLGQPVFALSIYLHAMTLVFLGMFVATSAGEVLFNKEEADILLHRPVTPRDLLSAKVTVLVQVSLWLAGAFNLAGLLIGIGARDGGWLFPFAHALSTGLEALFCTSAVVIIYQLCLRWFGRERLDNVMTTAQVLVAVAAVVGGQVVPQLLPRFKGRLDFGFNSWWVGLLPPAWFAGFDDALAGRGSTSSWALAALGAAVTGTVLWLAFGKLARDYERGLQTLHEAHTRASSDGSHRRWIDLLIRLWPLRWWFKDPVSRASFLLTLAYLVRDREVKLRVYPGIAPMLVMPLLLLIQDRGSGAFGEGGFGVAFTGCYLGVIPMLALSLLQYSQQWTAADLFRAAPLASPASLCHGARRAVLCLLAGPALIFFALLAWMVRHETSHLPLLLPGVLALPVYAMVANLGGRAVPLSLPTEEAKSTGRAVTMIGVMFISALLAAVSAWSWSMGWFTWLLPVEAVLALCVYLGMRRSVTCAQWPTIE